MDRSGIEHGPPKNLKEFYAKKKLKFMSSRRRNSDSVLKNSCLFCIGIRLINILDTEAARLSEMLILKYKILRFQNPEEYQRYESTSKIFNLVKENCTCRFYKLVNPLPETIICVAVRCTSIYFVCKLSHCLWHEFKSVFVTPVHLLERPTYLETAVLWTLS